LGRSSAKSGRANYRMHQSVRSVTGLAGASPAPARPAGEAHVGPKRMMKQAKRRIQAWMTMGLPVVLVTMMAVSGCGEHTVPPPDCYVLEGQVWVQMAEGVRADSANKALSAIGLPYDMDALRDCFILYFDVVSGSPSEHVRDLQRVTQAGVVGVSDSGQVFAALCEHDPLPAIAAGSALPDLEYDHIWWHSIDTTVEVPIGEEEDWVTRFMEFDFVALAQRVTWCPD